MGDVVAKPLARTGRRFLKGMAGVVIVDTLSIWVFLIYLENTIWMGRGETVSFYENVRGLPLIFISAQWVFIPIIVLALALYKWSNTGTGVEMCFRSVCVIFGVGLLVWLYPVVILNVDEIRLSELYMNWDQISLPLMVIIFLRGLLALVVFPAILVLRWGKRLQDARKSDVECTVEN